MADSAGAEPATAPEARGRLTVRLDARAIAGGIVIAVLFLTAIAAPFIAPHDPLAQDP